MRSATRRVPSYRLHKPTGQAVVTLNGKTSILARTTRRKAANSTTEKSQNGLQMTDRFAHKYGRARVTVVEILAAFWAHAESYYKAPDGSPGGELDNYR
ncbi:MAG: hypothetical protein ACREIT_09390 [Tepidisphaeraceae bacterium]